MRPPLNQVIDCDCGHHAACKVWLAVGPDSWTFCSCECWLAFYDATRALEKAARKTAQEAPANSRGIDAA